MLHLNSNKLFNEYNPKLFCQDSSLAILEKRKFDTFLNNEEIQNLLEEFGELMTDSMWLVSYSIYTTWKKYCWCTVTVLCFFNIITYPEGEALCLISKSLCLTPLWTFISCGSSKVCLKNLPEESWWVQASSIRLLSGWLSEKYSDKGPPYILNKN